MRCECGYPTETVDTRTRKNSRERVRRRQCGRCGARFTTIEIPAEQVAAMRPMGRTVTSMRQAAERFLTETSEPRNG